MIVCCCSFKSHSVGLAVVSLEKCASFLLFFSAELVEAGRKLHSAPSRKYLYESGLPPAASRVKKELSLGGWEQGWLKNMEDGDVAA